MLLLTRLVKGTSPVGIKYKSLSSLPLLVTNKSSANFGNCPVPINDSVFTRNGV